MRCLTRFCEDDSLTSKFIEKSGHGACLDLFRPYRKDHKNIFQGLKLLHHLVQARKDKKQEFFFAGIPEKIIDSYDLEWPIDIQKQIICLFSEMAEIEDFKEILANKFLEELVRIMKHNISNKTIIRNGIKLLYICSDNIATVEILIHQKANEMADEIIKRHFKFETILKYNLLFMENMIMMHESSRNIYLNMKTDVKVKRIYDKTHEPEQEEVHQISERVLKLFEGDFINLKDSFLEVEPGNVEKKNSDLSEEDLEELKKSIPDEVKNYLWKGKIFRIYGEDKV